MYDQGLVVEAATQWEAFRLHDEPLKTKFPRINLALAATRTLCFNLSFPVTLVERLGSGSMGYRDCT